MMHIFIQSVTRLIDGALGAPDSIARERLAQAEYMLHGAFLSARYDDSEVYYVIRELEHELEAVKEEIHGY